VATYFVLTGKAHVGAWLVIIAGVFDFADGFVARLLKATSPIGKELDSLADMITFGLVPGATIFALLGQADSHETGNLFHFSAFIMPCFAGLRLAKFNIDTRQSENFIGMPTPAVALFVVSLSLILEFDSLGLSDFILNKYFLYTLIPVFSFLMVSELPMFGLKLKSFDFKGNKWRYAFLVISIFALLFLQYAGIAVSIVLYILFSFIALMTDKT